MRRRLSAAPATAAGRANERNREAWIRRVLLSLPPGLRLLDAGAGERPYMKHCEHLRYVSQDFGEYDGVGDGVALQTGSWSNDGIDIVSDITSIPEPDGAFDVVLCTEVLEHVPDPVAAVDELGRLVRPGGLIILTSPFCSLTHFSPYHFATGFNRYFYETHLARLGFDVVAVAENGNYFEFVAQELWRLPQISRRYTRTGGIGSGVVRAFTLPLIAVLGFVSARDRGSGKVLCYGLHVVARKAGGEPLPIPSGV